MKDEVLGSLRPVVSALSVMLLLFVCGGATCARRAPVASFPPPPPVTFDSQPSLDQVVEVVNRTASVRQLSTNTAKVEVLSEPALPRLSATMNVQRDKDFRLRASLPILLGTGLDMGSNNEVFWFEVPTGLSKTLYYARHDQYQQQLSRAFLPVDPTFVTDSLGLVQIDPAAVIAGPVRRSDGRIEVRMGSMTPSGMYQRVLYIEPQAGYVTNQLVFDPSNRLVAESSASKHVYYDAQNVVLPHQVKLDLTPSIGDPISLQIEVSAYTVNQLLSGDPQLFVMPTGAANSVDLANLPPTPSGGFSLGTPPGPVAPPSPASAPVGMGAPAAAFPSGPSAYAAEAALASPLRGTLR